MISKTRQTFIILIVLQIVGLIAVVYQTWNMRQACVEAGMNYIRETSFSAYGTLFQSSCIIYSPSSPGDADMAAGAFIVNTTPLVVVGAVLLLGIALAGMQLTRLRKAHQD